MTLLHTLYTGGQWEELRPLSQDRGNVGFGAQVPDWFLFILLLIHPAYLSFLFILLL